MTKWDPHHVWAVVRLTEMLIRRGEHLSPAFASDMRVEVDAILGPAGQTMDDQAAEAAEAP